MRIPLIQSASSSGDIGRKFALLLAAILIVASAQFAVAARARALTVAVIGDSVAHDLGRGLEELFADKRHIRVIRQTHFATGLVRTDYYDWNAVVRDFLRHHHPDIVLVVIGGNDRQAIRVHGRRHDPLSKTWRADYRHRVSQFMNNFRHMRGRVYWLSLPPVRSDTLTQAYRVMNHIYAREAARHGFRYVSVWDKFTTPNGAYSSFGESLEGVKRRIRMDDGQHFTPVGRLVFAAAVAKKIGLR